LSQPVFSILSSAHDAELYLAEMIDSVCAQTFPDWELIIVDNGMSDEVVRIVEEYAGDDRIRLVRQEYKGLGGGVDAAADVARGRYYAVVHSDDVLRPTFCELTRSVLDENRRIDAVSVDGIPFHDDGRQQPPSFRQRAGVLTEPGIEHRVTLMEIIRGSALYYTAAIRAEAWEIGIGYACDTPKVEDLAMFLRMLAAGCDIRVLGEPLAGYRLHEDTAVGVRFDQAEYEESEERAFAKVAGLTDDPEVLAVLDQRLRHLRYERAMGRARTALRDSDATTAREQVRLALQHRRAAKPAIIYAVLSVAPALLHRAQAAKKWIGSRHSS
jgi:Glycosyl transferase family 2